METRQFDDYTLAMIGYTAYGEQTGWLTFDNRPMPQWDALPVRTRDAWAAAGAAIQAHVESGIAEIINAGGRARVIEAEGLAT